MPGGVYAAVSGMRTRLEELDRIAADLSNVDTAGYKIERASSYASERDLFERALDSAVDVVGGGTRVDFRGGTIATTGRDLDLALEGRGFLVVDTPRGERFTRNGSLTRRTDGVLTTGSGDPVLGDDGPITLPSGTVAVSQDGTIRVNDTVVGRIRIVEFSSGSDLLRESGAVYRAVTGAEPGPSTARIVSGALEESNVAAVDRMVALTEVTRTFESLQRGISVLMNELDGRAITEIGRR